MTSFQTVIIDFASPKFDSVVTATNTLESLVKESDRPRTLLILRNTKNIASDSFFIPLVDRWIRDFPGRVVLDSMTPSNTLFLSRLSTREDSSKVEIFYGKIVISETVCISFTISGPCRPNRLPQSDLLFPIGRLSAADAAHVPMTLNARLKCTIEDDASLFDLDHLVLVSSSMQIFWLQDAQTLVPIQNLETLKELCKEVKVGRVEKPTYIRSLAVNCESIRRGMSKTSFNSIVSKKQLGILKTRDLLETKVSKFFESYKKSTPKVVDKANYENTFVLKQISKMPQPVSQTCICEILAKTAEENLCSYDKRQRRLLGTSFNSHRWPLESLLNRDTVVDGPLLSEVVGELLT